MVRRDPIQRVADASRDLYDVADWEARSLLDRLSVTIYRLLVASVRSLMIVLAVAIVAGQFLLTGVASISHPVVGAYILMSLVPALALAVYVWRADVTTPEPLRLLVITFLLGFLFAGFAAVLNSAFTGVFGSTLPGLILFFLVIVGPVEETVKWLAVRLYAYGDPEFDAVIDGAVYGAMAGLGFATIENTLYITRPYLTASSADVGQVLAETFQVATLRGFAGPGHVIFSAFAGYYLGLAKFNPRNRGPIVVKGLLIAAVIHAGYNVSVTAVVPLLASVVSIPGLGTDPIFFGYVVVYDGVFGYALYRKLSTYRRTYRDVGADRLESDATPTEVERDEFEWDRRDR